MLSRTLVLAHFMNSKLGIFQSSFSDHSVGAAIDIRALFGRENQQKLINKQQTTTTRAAYDLLCVDILLFYYEFIYSR